MMKSCELLLVRKVTFGNFWRALSEQNALAGKSPIPRGDLVGLDAAISHVLDKIKHLINATFLPGWPILIHEDMDDGGGMHVHYGLSVAASVRSFQDRQGAMLSVMRQPPPPDNAEDGTWAKQAHGFGSGSRSDTVFAEGSSERENCDGVRQAIACNDAGERRRRHDPLLCGGRLWCRGSRDQDFPTMGCERDIDPSSVPETGGHIRTVEFRGDPL
jgi:hypothetical protein